MVDEARGVRVFIALAALAVAPRLLQLAGFHPLNWDEIEFFRATDWVRQGLVPYRDFWEHHTPLQWFVYAPFAALTRSPGAAAIIAMRGAQLPAWIATFALLLSWMRRAGVARWARWTAIVTLLCSSLFMLPAVEYRVDALGCFLFILGVWAAQRLDDGTRYALLCGAAFCLAGFANLRLGPAIILAALLIRIIRPKEGRWGGNVRANAVFAGAAATLAICAIYFVLTHSAAVAVRRVWTDNALGDRYAPSIPGMFVFRLLNSFGIRRFLDRITFDVSGIDPAGIVILVLGVAGAVRLLAARRRTPDDAFYAAFLAAANLLFVAAMKFVFNYHLLIVALLFVPLAAMEIERLLPRRAAVPLLALFVIVNASVSIFRAKEDDTRYQNAIMRAADAATPPGGRVFDGTGWALRRQPAYRYWFLRMIVTELEARGVFEPYPPRELLTDPPAAIVADHDLRVWLARHPALARAVTAHYLPREIDLWLPGMSALLTPARPEAQWIVPAGGTYVIHASRALAMHPWFRQPLYFDTRAWHTPELTRVSTEDVPLIVDGQPALPRMVTLRRGQRLAIRTTIADPLGIMITREDPRRLFAFPPPGVTLEASAPPRWHVPDFSVLLR